ncbi:MAG: class I SAM-dependent methyltransferase [bacterium]|nr:class I SAM-dependent methyltransferase [bacterium]
MNWRWRFWLRRFRRPLRPLPSVQAYERWAATYPPQAHNLLMQAEETAMLGLLPPLEGQTVVDLACGTGRYGQIALSQAAQCTIGIDNSPAMLRRCVLPVRLLAEFSALPLPTAFVDVIVCGLAIGHVPTLAPLFAEIQRILRPGGVLLVSDVHPFAALNGAQRTFETSGRVYAVEHHLHLISDVIAAAQAVELRLTALAEPRLGIHASPTADAPVIVVYRFVHERGGRATSR